MNNPEIGQYHKNLASLLMSEPNRGQRSAFLAEERKTPEYQTAKKEAMNRIKLVDRVLNPIFDLITRTNEITKWAENIVGEYNGLPKQNSKERKHANNLITQTASELLQNPQDISIAEETWRRIELGRDGAQESEEPFSKLVKVECLALIKDKWQGVKPEQLAQLVRITADNDNPSQDDAQDLLSNYFKGPRSRNQRIGAFYNFVSGVLDLAREDKAYKEGLRIALFATDILPKNPTLIEQAVLLSLPYGGEEEDFKKLIIAKYVVNQASSKHSPDFAQFHQVNVHFIATDEKAKREWGRKREIVTKKIGSSAATELNNAMMSFFEILQRPISLETKQSLKDTWPHSVAFDEADPLNQKFNRVFSDRLSHSSQITT